MASKFLDFIRWLNKSDISYCIPWGYERLPEHPSGGDVDLYVAPEHYALVANELMQRGYASAKCPAYRDAHRHAQFACVEEYTIDLFSSFCFSNHGKLTLLRIESDFLLQNRIFVNGMWIANPVLETLFTALRILGGRNDPMKRLQKYLEATS